MGPVVLILLLTVAVYAQHHFDSRQIRGAAQANRWSVRSLKWAPLARFFSGNRWQRCYWLQYWDDSGAVVRRLCRITGAFGLGESVFFEPVTVEAAQRTRGVPPPGNKQATNPKPFVHRLMLGGACALLGGWVGAAVGIFGAMVLFHGSNIAPAYGLLLVTPIGALAGGLFGFFRLR